MIKQKTSTGRQRVGLLDDIRGFCIIFVVVFHALYDLVSVFGLKVSPNISTTMNMLQPLVAGAFVFISGVVSRYSKSNIKRGLITLGLGTLISIITTVVSYFSGMRLEVRFGVLSLLGSSMLIFGLLQKIFPKTNAMTSRSKSTWVIFISCALLFFVTFHISEGYLAFLGKHIYDIPESFYSTSFLYPLGFPSIGFYSTDYFSIAPWLFLFLAGTSLGVFAKENKLPVFAYKSYIPFLNKVGKYSMVIYILHQPILMLIFGLISMFFQSYLQQNIQ